jgi:rod shape-determining protein MreD
MRVRRLVALGAMILTALLLQVSVLPLVAGGGFAPDLLVVLVVVLTLEHGARTGLWVAGWSGLLIDLATTTVPLGSAMLVMVTIAYLMGLLRPYLSERADLTTAILAGFAAVLSVLGHGALALLLSVQEPPTAGVITWSALIVGIFAVLLAPPVLVLVRRVLDRPESVAAEVGL